MSILPDRFLNKKHPHSAANATSFVSRQVPLNVQKANASTSFHFRIGTAPNQYIDPSASFLRWKVTNKSTNCVYQLGSAGAPAMFETISLLNSGSQISQYQNYGVFRSMKNAMNATSDWIKGPGSIMQGTCPSSHASIGRRGETIAIGGSRVFCDPICNHTSLFNSGRMVSIDTIDNLDLRYTLGDYTYGGAWDTLLTGAAKTSALAALNDSSLEISDLELVLSIVQLSSETAAQLRSAHPDGNICYDCRGIGRIAATVPAGVSAHNINLGLGYSSLMALNAVQLPQYKGSTQTDSIQRVEDHNNSTFVKNNLARSLFLIDGAPQENLRPIKGDLAEIAAFQQIATGNLHKYSGAVIADAGASTDPTYSENFEVGDELTGNKAFVLSQDLCIYKQKDGHWADSEMAVMCEGRGTLASSTQLNLEFNGASGKEVQMEIFPEFRTLIVLDANTKSYRVSQ